MHKSLPRQTFLFVILLGVFACGYGTSTNRFLRSELSNQGPLVISHDNPYIAQNLFLAREIESNGLIRGFIEHRGIPDAIEVEKNAFKSLLVYLFYLDKTETFLIRDRSGEWVIHGPEKMSDYVLAILDAAYTSSTPPPLIINGKVVHGIAWHGLSETTKRITTQKSISKQPIAQEKETSQPVTLNQVKESPSGDIIHFVRYRGETLRTITTWYTADVLNTNRIARINGLENPNLLHIGQQVRIPRYLLSTKSPLPYSEVEKGIERQKSASE